MFGISSCDSIIVVLVPFFLLCVVCGPFDILKYLTTELTMVPNVITAIYILKACSN